MTSTLSTVVRILLLPLIAGIASIAPRAANSADLAIRNVDYVDVEAREIVQGGSILIRDGRIARAGPDVGVPPAGMETIDGAGLVALPGFVNAHTHLWQHVGKGLETAGGLQEWAPLIHQCLHYCTPSEVYRATLAAAGEALLSGVTTTSDFASPYSEFMLDQTSAALKTAGIDGVVVYWNPAVFLPPDVKARQIERLAAKIAPLELRIAQGHAFLFEPPILYEGVKLARRMGLGLTEHTMETIQGQARVFGIYSGYLAVYGDRLSEADRNALQAIVAKGPPSRVDAVRWIKRLSGQILANADAVDRLTAAEKTELESWAGQPDTISVMPILDFMGAFDLPQDYIAIHANWANASDIALMAKKGVAVAHNPDSNQRLSSGIAPVWEYAHQGVDVTLGTDGAASNDGISVFHGMRSAWNLQKIESLDPDHTAKEIDAWSILRMATIDGAKAIGMDDRTGSIAAGKEADIVLLSKSRLGLSPIIDADSRRNLVPLVIYSADERAVDTVISNGRVVVRGGELLAPLSEPDLATELTGVANRVMRRQAAGKTWRETIDLADLPREADWFRWRSVREKDRIEIAFVNSSGASRRVYLAMSGDTEGGATAPMLSPATLARFPLDPPPKYDAREVDVGSGSTLEVTKAPGSYDYEIRFDGAIENRRGADEQILLLVPAEQPTP